MISLVGAALLLPLSHFLIASTRLRRLLVRRLGERRYVASYSTLTLVAFTWLIAAYVRAPSASLWEAWPWVIAPLFPVMLVGCILLVAGVSTPNPVIIRKEGLFDQDDIVRGILRVSRNSFFWGSALVALVQVIVLGSVAAILAFGSVAVLGIVGSFVLDAKKARQYARVWHSFAATTSNLPFLAIIRGRQHLSISEIGHWRIGSAFGVCLVVLGFDAFRVGAF